jgi:hypothetical protein
MRFSDIVMSGQKVLTIKDLSKVWNAFPKHSAYTTLLLDDSFLKAQRQPWNHLILPEYIAETRARDVAVYSRLSGLTASSEDAAGVAEPRHGATDCGGQGQSALPRDRSSSHEDNNADSTPPDLEVYDETLLAVIGILDALKHESNVSHWLRAGTLLSPNSGSASHNGKSQIDGDGEVNVNDNEALEDTASSDRPLWFADAAVARSWADKGRSALAELGINLVHGVKP